MVTNIRNSVNANDKNMTNYKTKQFFSKNWNFKFYKCKVSFSTRKSNFEVRNKKMKEDEDDNIGKQVTLKKFYSPWRILNLWVRDD